MFSVCCSEFISVALMFPMFVFVLDFNLKALLSRLACQCVFAVSGNFYGLTSSEGRVSGE